MTYYNIDKLNGLKLNYIASIDEGEISNRVIIKGLIITDFIEFLREKENASFFDPNQLEIPFPDEDNSK